MSTSIFPSGNRACALVPATAPAAWPVTLVTFLDPLSSACTWRTYRCAGTDGDFLLWQFSPRAGETESLFGGAGPAPSRSPVAPPNDCASSSRRTDGNCLPVVRPDKPCRSHLGFSLFFLDQGKQVIFPALRPESAIKVTQRKACLGSKEPANLAVLEVLPGTHWVACGQAFD